MIVINQVMGNLNHDPIWKSRLQKADVDFLTLSQWEAQKSRCRKTTQSGQDIGIVLDRSTALADGDILLWDEKSNTAVVVKMQLRDVMVIQIKSLLSQDPNSLLQLAFNLGHALGNQHWKSVIKDGQVFVPLTITEKVMETVLKTHGFNLPYSFAKGKDILPLLTQSEARLLFGGAEDSGTHVHVANGFQIDRAS